MNLKCELWAAINTHLRLVDTLGEDHPDTLRALMLVMELAPDEVRNRMASISREMGLMPEADGYLEDGSPVFRQDNVAVRLGMSQAEAEKAMHEMHADWEALGIPNTGIVTDAALIHWNQ